MCAQFLNAQVQQIVGDPVAPGLAGASPATLVYGSPKFRHPDGMHGRSLAAQVTLYTLDGLSLVVQLDGTGLSLLSSDGFSHSRYMDVCDLLAHHSPAYVAAYREANGVDPVVKLRTSSLSGGSGQRSRNSRQQQMQQWTQVFSRTAPPGVRLRGSLSGRFEPPPAHESRQHGDEAIGANGFGDADAASVRRDRHASADEVSLAIGDGGGSSGMSAMGASNGCGHHRTLSTDSVTSTRRPLCPCSDRDYRSGQAGLSDAPAAAASASGSGCGGGSGVRGGEHLASMSIDRSSGGHTGSGPGSGSLARSSFASTRRALNATTSAVTCATSVTAAALTTAAVASANVTYTAAVASASVASSAAVASASVASSAATSAAQTAAQVVLATSSVSAAQRQSTCDGAVSAGWRRNPSKVSLLGSAQTDSDRNQMETDAARGLVERELVLAEGDDIVEVHSSGAGGAGGGGGGGGGAGGGSDLSLPPPLPQYYEQHPQEQNPHPHGGGSSGGIGVGGGMPSTPQRSSRHSREGGLGSTPPSSPKRKYTPMVTEFTSGPGHQHLDLSQYVDQPSVYEEGGAGSASSSFRRSRGGYAPGEHGVSVLAEFDHEAAPAPAAAVGSSTSACCSYRCGEKCGESAGAAALSKAAASQLIVAAQVAQAQASEYMDIDVSTSRQRPPPTAIPAAGHAFCGHWRHLRSEAYGDFLSECVGLSWAIKKIGERIHPTPFFHIRDGQLLCETVCLGAKPVHEAFVAGHSRFNEPNQGVEYEVDAWWEHGDTVFVASRRHPAINSGRPIVKRVYIDTATGELHIDTSWGGKRDFLATFSYRGPP